MSEEGKQSVKRSKEEATDVSNSENIKLETENNGDVRTI